MFIVYILVGIFFIYLGLNYLFGDGLSNLENKVDSYNEIIKNQKENDKRN